MRPGAFRHGSLLSWAAMATSRKAKPKTKQPMLETPATRGAREARAWLATLGIEPSKPKWYVELFLDAHRDAASVYSSDTDTVFRLSVFAHEWGFIANKPGAASHVRVQDEPFVHGRDAFGFAKALPRLDHTLLRAVEHELGVKFPRDRAFVRTNVAGAKAAVLRWLATS